jgi:hypothetical protein
MSETLHGVSRELAQSRAKSAKNGLWASNFGVSGGKPLVFGILKPLWGQPPCQNPKNSELKFLPSWSTPKIELDYVLIDWLRVEGAGL